MEIVHRNLLPSIKLLELGGIQAERGSRCNGALAKVWPTSPNSLKDALIRQNLFIQQVKMAKIAIFGRCLLEEMDQRISS